MMMCWTIVLFYLIGSTLANDSIDSSKCTELRAQDLDLDRIMGKWYVIEIMDHRPSPTLASPTLIRPMILDTCPIVKIRKDRGNLLKLLWTEEEGNIEYTFKINDLRIPGFWSSTSLQNGTLTQDPTKNYVQFGGTVHVLKAVKQEMLLTFCSGYPGNQLYSILLGREHKLRGGTRGIHDLLMRLKIMISTIQSTCAKGAAAGIQSNAIFIITIFSVFRFLYPALSSCLW